MVRIAHSQQTEELLGITTNTESFLSPIIKGNIQEPSILLTYKVFQAPSIINMVSNKVDYDVAHFYEA